LLSRFTFSSKVQRRAVDLLQARLRERVDRVSGTDLELAYSDFWTQNLPSDHSFQRVHSS